MIDCRLPDITAEFVRSVLDYDPTTGVLTWRERSDAPKKWNTRYAGTVAGFDVKGHVHIQLVGANHYAHRLAWMHVYGTLPPDQIDHINGIRSDNRIANLRPASNSENGCNKAMQRNNTSGFTGVNFNRQRGKWEARITKDGATVRLGFFDTPEQGNQARQSALAEFHGEFARIDP